MPDRRPCRHADPRRDCPFCLRYVYLAAKRKAWGGPAELPVPAGWPAESPPDLNPPQPAPAARDSAARTPREPAPASGPGTELKLLLESLGLKACWGCSDRAARMNRWGVAGCRRRRAEIVGWLREQQKKAGWLATFKAGVAALAAGMLPDPLDPLGWLVDEAIRRAESNEPSTPGGT